MKWSKALLPVCALTFALPLMAQVVKGLDLSGQLQAFAEPPELMAGCQDVPEAVALTQEFGVRALRIERYMAELDRKKTEIAAAEASLKTYLRQIREQRERDLKRIRSGNAAVEDDISRLISVYDQMQPKDAAKVLSNLPPDFAAEILMRIAPETGAKIIAAIEPQQAAIFTTHMGARSVPKN